MLINNNCLCSISNGITNIIKTITKLGTDLSCTISDLVCNSNDNNYTIYATLAANNPRTVAGEYPMYENDTYVYTTTKVRLLDMLNPNMYLILKRNPNSLNQHLPIYLKDTSNFAHAVMIGDINTPAYGDNTTRNYNYPALYVGNYIILNPTQQTLDDFKNGLISN